MVDLRWRNIGVEFLMTWLATKPRQVPSATSKLVLNSKWVSSQYPVFEMMLSHNYVPMECRLTEY